MLELLGLVFFGFIVYAFLIVVPTAIEKLTSEEFKAAYYRHLSSLHINSYGR